MSELPRGLNDAFVASLPLQADERKDYVPGDVDREKIYRVWNELFKRQNRKLPEDPEKLLDLADQYLDRSLSIALVDRKSKKAMGYGYFGALLSLKVALLVRNDEHEKIMRAKLRTMERQLCEEELLPKLLTAK